MSKINKIIKENRELKERINFLLETAKENEIKFKRFEQIEFKLMAANSMTEILDILLLDYNDLFKIKQSILHIVDHEDNIQSMIPANDIEQKYQQRVIFRKLPSELEQLEKLAEKIYMGSYQKEHHQWLLKHQPLLMRQIRSIAILPLIRHEKIIGLFCCCSSDLNRFTKESANDFVVRMAYIISVCIENVINYETLKRNSLTDTLTQIPNRRYFDQAIFDEITRVQRTQKPLSCLLLDIDHFKQVNDTHGHKAGDEVLYQVAQRIASTLRTHEIFARYGGEEFVILLPETSNHDAIIIAQRIIQVVNQSAIPVDVDKSLDISLSIGIATFDKEIELGQVKQYCHLLVEVADRFLYQAKESGRNRACNGGIIA